MDEAIAFVRTHTLKVTTKHDPEPGTFDFLLDYVNQDNRDGMDVEASLVHGKKRVIALAHSVCVVALSCPGQNLDAFLQAWVAVIKNLKESDIEGDRDRSSRQSLAVCMSTKLNWLLQELCSPIFQQETQEWAKSLIVQFDAVLKTENTLASTNEHLEAPELSAQDMGPNRVEILLSDMSTLTHMLLFEDVLEDSIKAAEFCHEKWNDNFLADPKAVTHLPNPLAYVHGMVDNDTLETSFVPISERLTSMTSKHRLLVVHELAVFCFAVAHDWESMDTMTPVGKELKYRLAVGIALFYKSFFEFNADKAIGETEGGDELEDELFHGVDTLHKILSTANFEFNQLCTAILFASDVWGMLMTIVSG
eukprot:m.343302 g.343302  ORF g.343302 m.343302 type:complete len:364 (+) comp22662_c0_seq1:96-1187(+)